MKYEELPDDIRRILPKSKFGSAHLCQDGSIITYTNYDRNPDRWKCNSTGRWEHVSK